MKLIINIFFGFIVFFYLPSVIYAYDACNTSCPGQTGDADLGVNFTGLQPGDINPDDAAKRITVTLTAASTPPSSISCSRNTADYCACDYPAVGGQPSGTAGYTASCNAYNNNGNIECQVRHLDCRNKPFNYTITKPAGYTCAVTSEPDGNTDGLFGLNNCSYNGDLVINCSAPAVISNVSCKVYNGSTDTSTCLSSGSTSGITTTTGNTVTWCVSRSGGTGTYDYSWSGDDSLSGATQSVTKTYSTTGSKTASVTVSSGTATPVTNSCPTVTVNATPPPPSTPTPSTPTCTVSSPCTNLTCNFSTTYSEANSYQAKVWPDKNNDSVSIGYQSNTSIFSHTFTAGSYEAKAKTKMTGSLDSTATPYCYSGTFTVTEPSSCQCGRSGQKCCSTAPVESYSGSPAYWSRSSACNSIVGAGNYCKEGEGTCSNTFSVGETGSGICQRAVTGGSCLCTVDSGRPDGCSCSNDNQCSSNNCNLSKNVCETSTICSDQNSRSDCNSIACSRCSWYACSNRCYDSSGIDITTACAPLNFTLTATPSCYLGDPVVNLSWTDAVPNPSYAGLMTYTVNRWNTSTSGWDNITTVSVRSAVDTSVSNDTSYTYKVNARYLVQYGSTTYWDTNKDSNTSSATTACRPDLDPDAGIKIFRVTGTGPSAIQEDVTGSNIYSGDRLEFRDILRNTGTGNADYFNSRFCLSLRAYNAADEANCYSTSNSIQQISNNGNLSLGTGQSNNYMSFRQTIYSTISSTQTVYFCADNGKIVTETNENNNCSYKQFTLITPFDPWIQTDGDVHSNTKIDLSGGPP